MLNNRNPDAYSQSCLFEAHPVKAVGEGSVIIENFEQYLYYSSIRETLKCNQTLLY